MLLTIVIALCIGGVPVPKHDGVQYEPRRQQKGFKNSQAPDDVFQKTARRQLISTDCLDLHQESLSMFALPEMSPRDDRL